MSATAKSFSWNGKPVAFEANETIASALERAGVALFGTDRDGGAAKYFCGIGACQACVVSVDGVRSEACLTPAREGLSVSPVGRVGS